MVTANPALIRMVTGATFEAEERFGPFPTPPILVSAADGPPILVCPSGTEPSGIDAVAYVGLSLAPIVDVAGAAAAFTRVIDSLDLACRRVVIDEASVPAQLARMLPTAKPASASLWDLTAVKSPGDIEAVAAAVRSCDAGHAAARIATREGQSTTAVLAAARQALGASSSGTVPLLADVIVTPMQRNQLLVRGATLLCDLAPRVDGMWADSAATWIIDAAPTRQQSEMHQVILEALRIGISALQIGARAGDVDRAMRESLGSAGYECRHHMGHGVGFSWHDAPRIVPNAETLLEAGMVIALEPAAYTQDAAVRVEQVIVVTSTGPQVLSRHDVNLVAT